MYSVVLPLGAGGIEGIGFVFGVLLVGAMIVVPTLAGFAAAHSFRQALVSLVARPSRAAW